MYPESFPSPGLVGRCQHRGTYRGVPAFPASRVRGSPSSPRGQASGTASRTWPWKRRITLPAGRGCTLTPLWVRQGTQPARVSHPRRAPPQWDPGIRASSGPRSSRRGAGGGAARLPGYPRPPGAAVAPPRPPPSSSTEAPLRRRTGPEPSHSVSGPCRTVFTVVPVPSEWAPTAR